VIRRDTAAGWGGRPVHSDAPVAVVLAGGKGRRLLPFTTSFPKPLMPVGDRPILEILVLQLARQGFGRLVFAVGHLAELIEAYFGDGSRWGVKIEYHREGQPLGTAGPLKGLVGRLPDHFLVINGDVLCDLNYATFLGHHRLNCPGRLLTISTHQRLLRSEYGVLSVADGLVGEYQEKPSYPLCVSEGIYAFSRHAVDWIPDGLRFDFPDLVVALLAAQQPVVAVDHDGLWLDIGRPEDYEQAQQLMADHPERFTFETSSIADCLPMPSDVVSPNEVGVSR
jgi:NDP-sugar pyrophosphorylase family protein